VPARKVTSARAVPALKASGHSVLAPRGRTVHAVPGRKATGRPGPVPEGTDPSGAATATGLPVAALAATTVRVAVRREASDEAGSLKLSGPS
jgi:hypothetical protein